MRDDQTFFVGVGAMKAGTTWLHDYLHDRDDVFMPKMKELHYFNVRFRPEMSKQRHRRVYTEVATATAAVAAGAPTADKDLMWEFIDRLAMEREPAAYRAFFEKRVQSHHTVFGEITPAYSLLGLDGLAAIKDQFPQVKVIFLLRDPVSRYVSQLKFTDNTGMFDAFLDRPGFVQRGAYDVIWKNLVEVFGPANIHAGFYENLFADDSVAGICDFLGLPFKAANYDKRVNPSQRSFEPSADQELRARKAFRGVYEFCEETFGNRIPAKWLKAA